MIKNKYCSFKPIVPLYDLEKPIDWAKRFDRNAPIVVEIGFGMGEVLVRSARDLPDQNFIGIEQHWERIYKTLKTITREQDGSPGILENIRILKIDARVVFERLFAPESIDSIYCLFPCPWPKKGHVRHRLFSNNFLKLLNNRLKKGGELKIVTDFYPYAQWILEQVECTGFQVETTKILPQYDTKFERKWKEEGQKEFFEQKFLKKEHINVPFTEDVPLKNYVIKNFDFDQLKLQNETGEVSVVFKDTFFDQKKQKVMIHSLIAEEHLTQHFWITIIKKQDKWRLAKAEGQSFFPTDGIAKALALVYEAAVRTTAENKCVVD